MKRFAAFLNNQATGSPRIRPNLVPGESLHIGENGVVVTARQNLPGPMIL